MDPDNKDTQKKRLARSFLQAMMWSGLLVGMGFVAQSIGMLFYKQPLFSTLLLTGGLILIPVLLTQELRKYRLIVFGEQLSYSRCVTVMGVIYLFALIVATLAYLLVFTYLFRDPMFVSYMEQSIELAGQMLGGEADREVLLESYRGITPALMTRGVISLSFTLGTLYIFIASIFLRRG
ncbi:DUF4199 family protein [uncultured Porphyromonas sp.]|uniref:DUF4199 family protein n=1 Tax=uncultured Porphyromonas sp. TaxID=159274 RepID=UPI002597AD26|nr:DUF4199 family protein [uncultured Porphyromonas sp.]